jgi:hypothetical protein
MDKQMIKISRTEQYEYALTGFKILKEAAKPTPAKTVHDLMWNWVMDQLTEVAEYGRGEIRDYYPLLETEDFVALREELTNEV